MPSLVRTERIIVQPGRLICEVAIDPPARRQADGSLVAAALREFPSLPHHACINGVGPTFGDVIAKTSIPHLLEHIAIDIQTREADDARMTFVGTTEWIDEARARARIELSFSDDAAALGAFNRACDFLNAAAR